MDRDWGSDFLTPNRWDDFQPMFEIIFTQVAQQFYFCEARKVHHTKFIKVLNSRHAASSNPEDIVRFMQFWFMIFTLLRSQSHVVCLQNTWWIIMAKSQALVVKVLHCTILLIELPVFIFTYSWILIISFLLLKSYGTHSLLLVGGLEHDFYFSIYWECHHPNGRTHIFQRGRSTTNQINRLSIDYP